MSTTSPAPGNTRIRDRVGAAAAAPDQVAARPQRPCSAQPMADHAGCTARIEQLQAALDAEQQRAENLSIALDTNREIGMAMGILMARHRLTQEKAFTLLRTLSQRTNRKLRDIAAEVVLTGMVDPRLAAQVFRRLPP